MRSLFILGFFGAALFSTATAEQWDKSVDTPGATLHIEFASEIDKARSRDVVAWIKDIADQVSTLYGRFPVSPTRVLIIPTRSNSRNSDSPVPFGRVTRRGAETVELYVDIGRPIEDMYADWTATHEFSHLLLPRISWRNKWISEGFASYYQNVLMARTGQYTQAQAIRLLGEGFERGRRSRPDLSPNQAAEEGVRKARYKIYWSGAAIALLADIELRERSGGRESLDTVLGQFQHCCLPTRKRWSGVEFFSRLDSFLDAPVFIPLYRQHADSRGFPETREALNKALVRDQIFSVRTSTH